MPTLSRWFIKSGFVSLALALVLEAIQLRPASVLPAVPDAAVHLAAIHLLTVGWLLQLIIGVAYWMFPRHPTKPPRGDVRYGWWAFGLLNLGLALRVIGEPWRLGWDGPALPLVLAALCQLAGIGSALLLLWPRIRATAG
jgi:hypothetical protein